MLLMLTSCEDHKKFQIKKGQVGYITKKTTIHDLNEIFKNDSIVVHLSEGALGNTIFKTMMNIWSTKKEGSTF